MNNLYANISNKKASNAMVTHLLDSAMSIAKSDSETAESLSLQARNYAEKIGFKYGVVEAVFSLGYINQINGKKDKGIVFYLEAAGLLDDFKTDEGIALSISVNRNIGMIFHDHYQYDKAIEYYTKSISLAKNAGLKNLEIEGKYFVARSLREKGFFEEAINELFAASELAMTERDHKYLVKINGQLGLLFKDIGDYENSLKHHFEVFRYKSEVESFESYAGKAYHNAANVYLLLGDVDKAEEYFLKAIDSKILVGGEKKAFISYMDLAELYKNNGKLKLSQLFYNKALNSDAQLDDDPEKFKIFKQMADLASKRRDAESYMLYNQRYTAFLEKDIHKNREIVETDQQYNIQLVTQRYFELVAAKQREEDLKKWGIWVSIIVLLSLATYFTIAKVRAYRMRRLLETELREAMADLNFDDL